MKNRILITVLMVVVCYGIGQAQQCPIGCQDEDRRLAKPSGSPAKSNLSSAIPSEIHPDPNPAKHFAESVRGAGASQPHECSSGPRHGGSQDGRCAAPECDSDLEFERANANQAVFAASCRTTGNVLARATANISVFLGRLRQEASGNDVYGIKVAVDGCSAATGQIPVEITVLSKL